MQQTPLEIWKQRFEIDGEEKKVTVDMSTYAYDTARLSIINDPEEFAQVDQPWNILFYMNLFQFGGA